MHSSFIFTGKERDIESGNDYFGARYYGSSMGRWTSSDPSGLALSDPGNPQTLNLYAYVSNHPLTSIDPDGLSWFTQPCTSSGRGTGAEESATSLGSRIGTFIGNLFCGGGGGDGGGGDDGGWSSTPHHGKNLVNVYYPLGAGVVGGHISVGTYDSDDPNADPRAAFGFTTVKQAWYVRTMLIVGYPFFKGRMEPDSESPRSRQGVEYRYLPISDDGFAKANAAINNHNGNYRFWLLPRNCANAAEDVDHAAGAPGVPHHEIFWPHAFWWLSAIGWAH